jgi:RHS repeat-associated protein
VTDQNGELYEHIEYFPFGETWVQEKSNTQKTPYLYTGKELDEETGLYYYGARYYDPRTSVWASADPILDEYLDGKRGFGGVYNAKNFGLYSYTHLNPLILVDPDGNAPNSKDSAKALAKVATDNVNAVSQARYNQAIDEYKDRYPQLSGEAGALNIIDYTPQYEDQNWGEFSETVGGAAAALITKRPNPTVFAKSALGQMRTVLKTAQVPYKGSTVVGHALSKHAGRNPQIWGKITGSMKTWNEQAMKHVREIMRGPGGFEKVTNKDGISFLEKMLDDGRGMRLNMDGTFKGFID